MSSKKKHVQLAYQDDEDDDEVEKEELKRSMPDMLGSSSSTSLSTRVPGIRLPSKGSASKVLIHSCCAPCSGAMIEEMVGLGLMVTVLFYNPNIHPRAEYEIRKEENKRYARELGIPFVDADYDATEWFKRARGMEYDPERGRRCTMCFDMRLERTALHAFEHGFDAFTTTNATSRWKDQDQVNGSGRRAAEKYPGLQYWFYDWQSEALTRRKYEISAQQRFYKQEYCGCAYSLRDTNLWRKGQGMAPVKIGTSWFSDPDLDEAEESLEVVGDFFAKAAADFGDPMRAGYASRKKLADQAEGNNW